MISHVLSNSSLAPNPKSGQLLMWVLATGLWAIFSLPPILLSGVFPMDMHFFFVMGTRFQTWLPWILWPENVSGRYFPVYWLFYTAEFMLFGASAGAYLAVQSVILAAGAGLAALLVGKTTKSLQLATLMIVLWYLNTPLAENISTVGKSEPLACFLILAALANFYRYSASRLGPTTRFDDVVPAIGSALLVLLSIWTKETSVVAIGVALTGLVLSFALSILWERADIRRHAGLYLRLVCALLVAVALSQAHRLHEGVPPPGSSSSKGHESDYVTFKITSSLVLKNIQWYIEQQPDVFVFGILALFFLLIVGRKLWIERSNIDLHRISDYVFVFSLFAAAAVYYCTMCFWRWPMGYYMFFPSIVFKICFLYSIHAARIMEKARRLICWPVFGLVGVSAAYAAFYCFYIISSQVVYSRVYTDAIFRFLRISEANKTLLVESYPFYAEQADVTQVFLRYFAERQGDGQRILVHGISDVLDPYVASLDRPENVELMRMLGLTKEVLENNFKNVPKQGDYLLTLTGGELGTWFLRGVAPYYSEGSVLQAQGAYDMRLIAEKRETVAAIDVNAWTGRPACEEHWVGYQLYQVMGAPRFFWRGRYPDGWTEKNSSLTVYPSYGHPVVIKFSAPKASLPQKIVIKKDGVFYKDYEISDTNEQTLALSGVVDKPVVFEFEVDHAFRPSELGIGPDVRPTGVLLRLDSMPAPQPAKGVAPCF